MHQFRSAARLCHAGRMPYAIISQLDRAREHCEAIPLEAAPAPNLTEQDRFADPFAGGSKASQRSLSDYFTQQHELFADTELAALLEPRRIQAPPGYHATKCVSAGLFALLGNRSCERLADCLHPHGNRRDRSRLPADSVSCPDLLR